MPTARPRPGDGREGSRRSAQAFGRHRFSGVDYPRSVGGRCCYRSRILRGRAGIGVLGLSARRVASSGLLGQPRLSRRSGDRRRGPGAPSVQGGVARHRLPDGTRGRSHCLGLRGRESQYRRARSADRPGLPDGRDRTEAPGGHALEEGGAPARAATGSARCPGAHRRRRHHPQHERSRGEALQLRTLRSRGLIHRSFRSRAVAGPPPRIAGGIRSRSRAPLPRRRARLRCDS